MFKMTFLDVYFFADDIMLIDETQEGVDAKLNLEREMLEVKGLCLDQRQSMWSQVQWE